MGVGSIQGAEFSRSYLRRHAQFRRVLTTQFRGILRLRPSPFGDEGLGSRDAQDESCPRWPRSQPGWARCLPQSGQGDLKTC